MIRSANGFGKLKLSVTATLAVTTCFFLASSSSLNAAEAVSFKQTFDQANLDLSKGYARSAIDGFVKCLKLKPDDSASLLGLALSLKKNGESNKAIPYFRKVLSADPNNASALLNLAEILSWDMQTRSEALMLLRRLVDAHPENLAGRSLIADVTSWTKETHDEAIQHLRVVVEKNPKDLKALLLLAQILNWKGKFTEAEPFFVRYLNERPEDLDTRLELARQLSYRDGSRLEAIRQFDSYLAKRPADDKARFERAMTLAWMKNYNQAIPELRELASKSPFDLTLKVDSQERSELPVILAFAQVLSWSGNFAEAEPAFAAYLKRFPNDWAALGEYGSILSYQKAKRLEALDVFDRALALRPGDAKIRAARAHTLRWVGRHPEAKEELLDLVKQFPNDANLEKALGQTLLDKNQAGEALMHLQIADKLNPGDFETEKAIAICYLRLSQIADAEKLAKQLLQKNPDDSALNFAMAEILAGQNKLEEALGYLRHGTSVSVDPEERLHVSKRLSGPRRVRPLAMEAAVQLLKEDPNNADVLLLLARMQSWEDASREQALKNFDRYLSLRPNDKEAMAYRAEVLSWTKKRKLSLKMYAQLLSQYPDDMDIRARHALVLSWTGHVGKAMKEYRRILKTDPTNRLAMIGLAQCTSWQGDFLKSERLFKQADAAYANDVELLIEQAMNYKQMGRLDKAKKLVVRVTELLKQDPSYN